MPRRSCPRSDHYNRNDEAELEGGMRLNNWSIAASYAAARILAGHREQVVISRPRSTSVRTSKPTTEPSMILGMSVDAFTILHVIVTLVAIGSGLIVVGGLFASNTLPVTTALFLFAR